jgi:hypothetical protein
MAKWIKGSDQKILLERLERIKTIQPDGSFGFDMFEHREITSILTSMLTLNPDVPSDEYSNLIHRATFGAAASGIITEDSILKELKVQEANYLRQKIQPYQLVTDISLVLTSTPITFKLKSSRITIGQRLNKKTAKVRSEILENSHDSIVGKFPNRYTNVVVRVSGRTPTESATKALNDLDLLRGILNLWINGGTLTRISDGKNSPVNAIILGPVHTLHRPNGEAASDSWWYEPGYRGPVEVWKKTKDVQELLTFFKAYRRNLAKLQYQELIISAIIQYTRALNSRDWNYSFLQLWSILEKLTGTANHDEVISRAAFVFSDWSYELLKLKHLRHSRNKAIHEGSEIPSPDVEVQMYQLKQSVETLLLFHVKRFRKFQSISHVVDFLSAPRNPKIIQEQLKKLDAVRRFLKA